MTHAGTNDIITLKADDHGDTLTLMFESEKQVGRRMPWRGYALSGWRPYFLAAAILRV